MYNRVMVPSDQNCEIQSDVLSPQEGRAQEASENPLPLPAHPPTMNSSNTPVVVPCQRRLWDDQHRNRADEHAGRKADIPNTFATECSNYLPNQAVVLEIGSANGRDARYFACTNNAFVIAVDFSTAALRQLTLQNLERAICKKAVFPIVADAKYLPLGGSQLDAVYARSALHLNDAELDSFFQTVMKLLKPGGYVMIEGKNEKDRALQESEVVGTNLFVDRVGHVRRLWNENIIRAILKKFDLTEVEMKNRCEDIAGDTKYFHQ